MHEFVAQAQHVHVVGDAQILSHLVLLDVHGADDNDDFGAILQLAQHVQLAVGFESGEHTAGMVVVEEFSAQFQIQFVAKLLDALLDVLGLYLYVFFVVKSYLHSFVCLMLFFTLPVTYQLITLQSYNIIPT